MPGTSPGMDAQPLHPVLQNAAEGILPEWANASVARRSHMIRVSDLMESWAEARNAGSREVRRWKATGLLHDALRDEDRDRLRQMVGPPFRELPGKILHGPGAARLLRDEGVEDEEILQAISYHTLGSPEFSILGLALYAADFLEPGRELREDWRATLRSRAPRELEAVVREILSARMAYLVQEGRPIHPVTLEFWNRMTEGQPWTGASEY